MQLGRLKVLITLWLVYVIEIVLYGTGSAAYLRRELFAEYEGLWYDAKS